MFLSRLIGRRYGCFEQVKNVNTKVRYNYRAFKDIIENQILANCHKFNQELFLSPKQIHYLSEQIYMINNIQEMVFLFRLLKLFSLTNEQINVLNASQRQKFIDYHQLRTQSDSASYKLMMRKEGKQQNEEANNLASEKGTEGEEERIPTLYVNIFRMKNELKDIIRDLKIMNKDDTENRFLCHIFINKPLNKLIQYALDRRGSEMDYYALTETYNTINRSLVTAEQMCLLIILLSTNETAIDMPNIFMGELESILTPIRGKEISYSLGRFLNRLRNKSISHSITDALPADLVHNSSICLDGLTLSLFLFDLKTHASDIDISFFSKFNSKDILQKLTLSEIRELLDALIHYEDQATQPENILHPELIRPIMAQLIENALQHATNLQIFNDYLLKLLELIIQFGNFIDSHYLASLLAQISSQIINQASGKALLTTQFTHYIVEFINICPPSLTDFYQLVDLFFLKQNPEKICYKQAIKMYELLAQTGLDSSEYLNVCHAVFSINKQDIIKDKADEKILIQSQMLGDAQTGQIFGVSIPEKERSKQLPSDIEFLSDFSDSDQDEATKDPSKQHKN